MSRKTLCVSVLAAAFEGQKLLLLYLLLRSIYGYTCGGYQMENRISVRHIL